MAQDQDLLDLRGCKRIALMGGTFDPIHNGHLAVAEAVRYGLKADRVVFIPSGAPLYKDGVCVSHREHRYLMTALAAEPNPFFFVSRSETDRPGPSYTVDTVAEFKERCRKDAKIFFITGADALAQLPAWKDAGRLLGMCAFVAVARPGYSKDDLHKQIAGIKETLGGRITVREAPELAVSSTEIRLRARSGQPIRYLVPDEVERYIVKHGLYRENWGVELPEIGELDAALRKSLSDRRYIHTLGVAETAAKLAERYGADRRGTFLAAMLHDIAKEIPAAEKLRLCERYGLKPDEIMKRQPDLTHGMLGAEIARRKFGLKDKDALNAICYHTTGRPGMSLLEKIIFISDAIEPNRPGYGGASGLRELAFADIDRAVAASLESAMAYTSAKGKTVHPLGKKALESVGGESQMAAQSGKAEK